MSKKFPPIHPGEILREEVLKPLEMSMNQLAGALRVPPNRIAQIVEGRRSISADTALRLARYLGTTPEFWMGLQMQFELERAQDDLAERLKKEIRPRKVAA